MKQYWGVWFIRPGKRKITITPGQPARRFSCWTNICEQDGGRHRSCKLRAENPRPFAKDTKKGPGGPPFRAFCEELCLSAWLILQEFRILLARSALRQCVRSQVSTFWTGNWKILFFKSALIRVHLRQSLCQVISNHSLSTNPRRS